ncbi:hypothetical protein SBI_00571 [Streptomyces bingchenggensis BCW-1]|uniref:Uncharacterized protein n=1 Tax=Streptomyces bingchenggensis (strain BCW-1) TaxID=749414 RepID=D7C0K1_STRBB|nr:hypothetical protein SBI_00571 [Streptomyces bingchenggensis BCW-1]
MDEVLEDPGGLPLPDGLLLAEVELPVRSCLASCSASFCSCSFFARSCSAFC